MSKKQFWQHGSHISATPPSIKDRNNGIKIRLSDVADLHCFSTFYKDLLGRIIHCLFVISYKKAMLVSQEYNVQ
jgi:hypothetical protein